MTQALTGILVLIASPGDTGAERATTSAEINDWNVTRGRRLNVAALPWLYERHAVPQLGERGQEIINRQAADRSDVVVAIFDSRLGSATGVDASGTAEEISRAADQGKPVHVYFSQEPLPRDVDVEQVAGLRDFKAGLEARGLLGSYSDPVDLAAQVVRAIEADIDDQGWGSSGGVSLPPGADLHWRHQHEREAQGVDGKGKMKYRTTSNHLVVENRSRVAADQLEVTVEPIGHLSIHFEAPDEPVDLPGNSSLSWLLIASRSMQDTGTSVRVNALWTEAGETKNGAWTVVVNG